MNIAINKYWFYNIIAAALSMACFASLRASVTGPYSLTFDYSDQGIDRAAANTAELNAFIQQIRYDGSPTPKNIFFADSGTYNFETDGDQWSAFIGVSNLTISGTGWQNVTVSWHCNLPPESFLIFDGACSNVEIKGLTFSTSYLETQTTGAHLKIAGSHFNVHDNTFTASPGFAIQLISFNGLPTSDHFDTNRFVETFADGIHVSAGSDNWIVGNVFYKTGDDAIAVVGDYPDTQKPSDVHVLANVIELSYFRGIAVISADNIWVERNVIAGTAGYGIEITTAYNSGLGGSPPDLDFAQRSNYAHINGNAITGVGTQPAHLYASWLSHDQPTDRDAINSDHAVNISINLESNSDYYPKRIQPDLGLLTGQYYSQSSNRYSVYMSDTLYGVVDNKANTTGSPAGEFFGSNNTGLVLHDYYTY